MIVLYHKTHLQGPWRQSQALAFHDKIANIFQLKENVSHIKPAVTVQT